MGTIPLIIHMTGLLLLAPDTRERAFPLHVLMPTEGETELPLHVAQLGWPSEKKDCPNSILYKYDEETGVCYFKLDSWAVELGREGTPTTGMLPPSGPFDVSYLKPVSRTLFGPMPVPNLRARVSIYSGQLVAGCPYAKWTIGAAQNRQLPNVVSWGMDIPDTGLVVTGTRQVDGKTESITIWKFPSTSKNIDLVVRQEPMVAQKSQVEPFEATHLHAFYELLDYPEGPRVIPYNGKPAGLGCSLSLAARLLRGPGTPTCMPAVGTP